MRVGYTLSSEEFGPKDLIRQAQAAEAGGFAFAMISDHFHPWTESQGESPFVWNMIGALSEATKTMNIGIGVNCPIIRYHPVLVAQAAATSQAMLEGRFVLGVGTGENLNEHVVGAGWPPYEMRREMLIEAIEIMRQLWQGKMTSYYGSYYTIDSAKIYTRHETDIPIIYSAMGRQSARDAGKYGDGLISTMPDRDLVMMFEESGGLGKAKYAQFSVCYDKDTKKAKEIVQKIWPLSGLPKPLNTELKLPGFFQKASQIVDLEEATRTISTGADTEAILETFNKYKQAGFTEIYVHNIGPNQEEFIKFFTKEVLPQLG